MHLRRIRLGLSLCAAVVMLLFGASEATSTITPLPPAALNTNAATDAGEDSNVSAATDGAGNWVAVWQSSDDLDGTIDPDLDILVARSTNAGATWTDAEPLDVHFETDIGDDRNCIVVPTQGAGNWLAVWQSSDDLGATIGADWDVLASQSTDNGVSWSTPVAVNFDAATDGGDSDGDALEVVTDGAGTVVVTWSSDKNLGGTLGTDADILFVRSTDNGANWSTTEALNTNADSDSVEDSSHAPLATDGAGNWVVVWGSAEDLGASIGMERDVLVSRSSNGGASWTAPQLLHEHLDTDSASEAFSGSVATDESGNWVAAWHSGDDLGATIGDDGDILVSRSTNNGVSWTTPAALHPNADSDSGADQSPRLATDGSGNWLATWQSRDDLGATIGADWDILVARSTDNGATWTGLQAVNPNADSDPGRDQTPRLATDGAGNWVIAWNSTDHLGDTIGYEGDILVSLSSDNGANWTAPAALNSNAASDLGNDWRQYVATDGAGNWVAVWHSNDDLGGTIGTDLDILVARSSDNGASWTAPEALHSHFEDDEGDDHLWSQLVTDGAGNWLVVWRSWDDHDDLGLSLGTDSDMLASRSTDNGATWSAPAPVNNDADSDTADDGWGFAAATDGAGTIVVTWCSGKNLGGTIGVDWDIIFARSTDNGVSWSDLAALNTNAASDTGLDYARAPVATDGAGNWVIIWTSTEDLESTGDDDFDHFVARSSDNGASWMAPEYLHDHFKTDIPSEEFRGWLATDGAGTWVATWMSYDNMDLPIGTDHEILMSRSTNNGADWTRPAPLNANATTDTGQVDWSPFVVADGDGNWVTVWHSYDYSGGPLGGDGDILAARSTDDGVNWTYPTVLNTNAYSDSGGDSGAHPATDGAGNWVTTWTSGDDLGGTIGADWDILYTTFAIRTVDSAGDAGDFSTADGVCDTDDSAGDGPCTLRAALEQANANPNLDNIEFDIDAATDSGCNAGTGVCTIQPASALPTMTQPVSIDGYTQAGASANTNPLASGSNAVLKIEIDGTNAGASTDGLRIGAGGSTIKGLVINRFGGTGIEMLGSGGNTVEGCFIGTDVGGLLDRGNDQRGVHIHDVDDNTIGGSTAAARNLVSGNGIGVSIAAGEDNVVSGNYIGTDITGTADLGNSSNGMEVNMGAANNTIGGPVAGEGNVISGNVIGGVWLRGVGTDGNFVKGNYIGVDATGLAALPNGPYAGISVLEGAQGNTIGGTTTPDSCDTDCNVISGGALYGVRISDSGTSGNAVSGNYIGVDATGTSALSNANDGVIVHNSASGNTIGGLVAGEANLIASNSGNGVCISETGAAGNAIRGNSIHSNGLLGIDLAPTGQACTIGLVTANDPNDPDTGPNDLMNYPVIIYAFYDGANTTVSGTLDTLDPGSSTIDVYATDTPDGSGHGEGRTYLGSTTAPDGSWELIFSGPSPYPNFSATATDSGGNTSEFSSGAEPDGDGDGIPDAYETGTGIYVSPTDTGTDPNDPDSDGDGVCDGGGAVGGTCDTAGPDNCPFIGSSPDQTNSDGLFAGDLCQCGDLDGDGVVDADDVTVARRHLVGVPIGGPYDLTRCNVIGPSDGGATDCGVADIFVLERVVAGRFATVENSCEAFTGPP